MRKIIVAAFVLLSTVPLIVNKTAYAHGGEDHGDDEKQRGKLSTLTNEVEIQKETQFLFDIRTGLSNLSEYNSILKLYGKVMSATNRSAQIIAPQNGSIVSLNATIGQKVGKGQILAVVEQNLSTSEQVQVSTEKSKAYAEYEVAKKEYERLKFIQDIVAKKDFQQSEIRFKTAETNKKIFDNLSSGNSKLYLIKSPIDGVVDNFNLTIGQQMQQGETMFSIYDTRKLKVEALIYDRDISKISKEVNFYIELIQENRKIVPAKLIAFSNVVSPVNQSSQIILEIENTGGDFKPGQFVNVEVLTKTERKQIVVPSSAISQINGKPVVFTHLEPEVFKAIYVQLGESNSENTVVLSGLKENERVVIKGTYQVKAIYTNQ